MTGLAADHRPERDQRVVSFRVGELLQGERRFERARHAHHGESGYAQFPKAPAAGFQHRDADALVEARAHDPDAQALAARVGLDLRHQPSRALAAFST